MKTTALITLLCATSTSAFVAPNRRTVQKTTSLNANNQHNFEKLTNAATIATATILSSPLGAIAEGDDYEYGAVDAPGGIGLAVGLGVIAITIAAVPVVLSPGEDAFNEMRDKDNFDEKRGR